MSKVSDYTKKINTFGAAIEKMLEADFPEKPEVIEKVEGSLAAIQFSVLSAFIEKGGK